MTDTLAIPDFQSIDDRWNWVLENLPAIGKDSRNEQQGFNYRSIDTVLDHVNPLLSGAGVHIIPVEQVAEYGSYTTGRGTVMRTCFVRAKWQIRDVGGDVIEAETVGEGSDAGDKATSKAQTMAFKYLLWPSLAISSNEDPDGGTAEPAVATQPVQSHATPAFTPSAPTAPPQNPQGGQSGGKNEVWPISKGQKGALWAKSNGGKLFQPDSLCQKVYGKREENLTWSEAKQLLDGLTNGTIDPNAPQDAGMAQVANAFPGAEEIGSTEEIPGYDGKPF